jgi:hypothetical protein
MSDSSRDYLGRCRFHSPAPSGNRLWRFGEARRATFWRHSKLCIIEPAAIGLRAVANTMPRWRGHEDHNKDFQTHAICGIATVRKRRINPGAGQPEAFGLETGSKPEVDDILKRRAQPGAKSSANK